MSGLYDGFRACNEDACGPTLYPPNKTPVTVDVLEIGLIFATVILFISLIFMLPGFSGKSIITVIVKTVFGVFITAAIMLCNFGQEWEVAHIKTKTQYRAGLSEEIHAEIGVAIGLRSVNITLKATPDVEVKFHHGALEERIDYNERFSWDNPGWVQGRAGFGPNAGRVNQEFRAGQRKGLPYPILWIAEYFTIDGEGIRWGRHYRQAGFYTHILMWLAFPTWLLAMILMHMVVRYGGYMSVFTSIVLFIANILYATIRNPLDLAVPFEDETLSFTWGWCFWLNIFNAFLTFIIGVIIIIGDLFFYDHLCSFFGLDVLSDYDEIYSDPKEISHLARVVVPASRRSKSRKLADSQRPNRDAPALPPKAEMKTDGDEDDDGPPPIPQKRQYRKRTVHVPGRKKKKVPTATLR